MPTQDRARSGATRAAVDRGRTLAAPTMNLTGAGAMLAMAVAAILGAIVDVLTGPGLGLGAGIMLSLSTLAAAWLVRRPNLVAVLVAPPLIYLTVMVIVGAVAPTLNLSLAALAVGLVYGFPAMAISTLCGVVVGGVRLISRR